MEKYTKETSFLFWQRWLYYSSIAFIFIGIALAFFGNSFIFLRYNSMLATIFWNTTQLPPQVVYFKSFISGPMGGTLACSYILLAFIVRYPFKAKEVWARNAIIVAFSVWCIIDSLICFQFNVYAQIYFINAFSILVKAVPIIFTWKEFK